MDLGGPSVFACELARIDRLGLNRRLIFAVPDVTDPNYQGVVASLIVPAASLPALINALAAEVLASGEAHELTSEVLIVMQTGPAN
jgi:hypothetical protein